MEEKVLNKKIDDTSLVEKKIKTLFQSIAFYLDKGLYAMDVQYIQEIIFSKAIYQVPNTNEKLLGVLKLRGSILPVYSLKLILGLEDSAKGKIVVEDEEKFIIMIKKEKDIFGILLDSIYKNIAATEDNFKAGKYIEKLSKNTLYNGVILDDNKEIFMINVDQLLKYIISLK